MKSVKSGNKLTNKFGRSSVYNPTIYKDDYNHHIPIKPVGMLPTTTDARVIPSQSAYKYRKRDERIIPPSKSTTKLRISKPKLDDTFERFEQEQLEEHKDSQMINYDIPNSLETQNNSTEFYMQASMRDEGNNQRYGFKNNLAANADRILSKSISALNIRNDEDPMNSMKSSEVKPNFSNNDNISEFSISKPRIGFGLEEGKEYYENLHLKRSKGMAPSTYFADAHKEIEDSMFHSNNYPPLVGSRRGSDYETLAKIFF